MSCALQRLVDGDGRVHAHGDALPPEPFELLVLRDETPLYTWDREVGRWKVA